MGVFVRVVSLRRGVVCGLVLVALGLLASNFLTVNTRAEEQKPEYTKVCNDFDCALVRTDLASKYLEEAKLPELPEAPSRAQVTFRNNTATYQVETRGSITANLDEFKALANQTLNDQKGWAKMGVKFQEVTGESNFTLVLSEASQMTTFSATGCDTTYSCRVGRFVVINQDRWLGATQPWNEAGGNLRDYRHMVINHEVGHWLGHGHEYCKTANQPAPVMQQQSINLQGCKFNPWPLENELWSSTLGI